MKPIDINNNNISVQFSDELILFSIKPAQEIKDSYERFKHLESSGYDISNSAFEEPYFVLFRTCPKSILQLIESDRPIPLQSSKCIVVNGKLYILE